MSDHSESDAQGRITVKQPRVTDGGAVWDAGYGGAIDASVFDMPMSTTRVKRLIRLKVRSGAELGERPTNAELQIPLDELKALIDQLERTGT